MILIPKYPNTTLLDSCSKMTANCHHQWVQTVPDRSKPCFSSDTTITIQPSAMQIDVQTYIRPTRVGVFIQAWVWRLRYFAIEYIKLDIKYNHAACTRASASKNTCITTQNIGRNSLNFYLHTQHIHQCDEWKVLQVLRWGGLDSCRM